MLKTSTRKTKYGYRGYVKCIGIISLDSVKGVIWTEKSGIDRICREHALEDAERMKKDREATWGEHANEMAYA